MTLRKIHRPVIRYMEWAKLHSAARYNLARSGVPPWPIEKLQLDLSALEITGRNFYGYPPLQEAIAERYEVAPANVATAMGTSMANYLACAAVLRRGDQVLIEKPAYEPLLAVPRLLGATVRRFDRTYAGRFGLNLGHIERMLNSKTRLIILSNLHNPSGVRVDDEVLRGLGRLAARAGAWVLVDEVYLESCFTGSTRSSVHLGTNFIVTSSLTKVFGLDGLRCGWILASDRKLISAIWRLNDFFGVNAVFPADQIAAAVFPQLDGILKNHMALLRRNWDWVAKALTELGSRLDWISPDGGTVCFPRLTPPRDSSTLAERLRRDYDTSIVPGHFFEARDHFRLSFGGETPMLRRALTHLREAMAGGN